MVLRVDPAPAKAATRGIFVVDTEQKEQMVSSIFFSVPRRLCGDSLFLSFIESPDFHG
jgi:hypothetical protein